MNFTGPNFDAPINRFWLTRTWVHGGREYRFFYDAETEFSDVDESYVKAWAADKKLLMNDIVDKGMLQKTPYTLWLPDKPSVTKVDLYWVKNSWRPSAFVPNKVALGFALNNAEMFIEYLRLGFGNKWQWVLNWLAYRYQNPKPARKPHTALYLYSTIHGVGKSTFATVLEEVYGRTNVKRVQGGESVTTKGSVVNWSRSLLIAEEVSPQLGSRLYQTIKSYTGQDTVEADIKHQAFTSWEIPAQLVMISNHAPTFFEASDRRFAVFNLDGLDGWVVKNDFYAWLDNVGFQAIADLLHSWQVDSRSVWTVPMTAEKAEALQMSTLDLTVERIKEVLANNPDKVFFEAHELLGAEKNAQLGSQLKHKAREAGVKNIGQQRIWGERLSLWVRSDTSEAQWHEALKKEPDWHPALMAL